MHREQSLAQRKVTCAEKSHLRWRISEDESGVLEREALLASAPSERAAEALGQSRDFS